MFANRGGWGSERESTCEWLLSHIQCRDIQMVRTGPAVDHQPLVYGIRVSFTGQVPWLARRALNEIVRS